MVSLGGGGGCKDERGKGWLLGSIYCSVLLPVRQAFALEPRLALNLRSFCATGLELQTWISVSGLFQDKRAHPTERHGHELRMCADRL